MAVRLRELSDRVSEILHSKQELTPWVAQWLPKIRQLEATLKDTSNWAEEQQDRADKAEAELKALVTLLEDVPGDTLEQKVQRMFHEMEQAHERITQLEAELEQLRVEGARSDD